MRRRIPVDRPPVRCFQQHRHMLRNDRITTTPAVPAAQMVVVDLDVRAIPEDLAVDPSIACDCPGSQFICGKRCGPQVAIRRAHKERWSKAREKLVLESVVQSVAVEVLGTQTQAT